MSSNTFLGFLWWFTWSTKKSPLSQTHHHLWTSRHFHHHNRHCHDCWWWRWRGVKSLCVHGWSSSTPSNDPTVIIIIIIVFIISIIIIIIIIIAILFLCGHAKFLYPPNDPTVGSPSRFSYWGRDLFNVRSSSPSMINHGLKQNQTTNLQFEKTWLWSKPGVFTIMPHRGCNLIWLIFPAEPGRAQKQFQPVSTGFNDWKRNSSALYSKSPQKREKNFSSKIGCRLTLTTSATSRATTTSQD